VGDGMKFNKWIILFIVIIFILLGFIIYKIEHITPSIENNIVYNVTTKGKYDKDKLYYNELTYKKFNSLMKEDKVYTIAVVDNSSNIKELFLEYVNKLNYKNSLNISVLNVSKLNKKDELKFYDIDPRFKNLGSNYIVVIKNKKVISITEYDKESINILINSLEVE